MNKPEEPPRIVNSIVDTIGNTPVVKLSTFSHLTGNYYAKLEYFNPGKSTKDRIGVTIINQAEKDGLLKRGGTVVEATSGNTGLGLALVAIQRGYSVILVMPDKMSPEKMSLVRAHGCQVIVCPTEVHPEDPRSYYSIARKIADETEGAFLANQYFNPANPIAHYETTGPEIWQQTKGKITHFVAGVGTGGTISGVAKFLKEQNPDIKIIGIDPEGSILAHYHKYRNTDIEAKSYLIEGVGEDLIPSTVDFDLIDEMVTVSDQEAFNWTRILAEKDGILVGSSGGMAAAGAISYFSAFNKNDNTFVVILLPDTGERYLGKVFSDTWLRAHGFLPPPKTIKEILTAKAANLLPLIKIDNNQSLSDALKKFRKFRVNQLIVEDNPPKLLLKQRLYNSLLKEVSADNPVNSIELEDVHLVDIKLSISELIQELLNHSIVLVKENDNLVGIITKQDIINNVSIS